MANFSHHTACPKCQENGNDRSGNNLGCYSDGSAYCFMCGYYRPPTLSNRLRTEPRSTGGASSRGTKVIVLPEDTISVLPRLGRDYLERYKLTEQDKVNNHIMWSEQYQRIIFPYFDSIGLLGWQGRYLGIDKTKPKWYSQGDLKSILHILGNVKSNTVCLVEDVISAIKVGHLGTLAVSPLFGSHVSTQRLLQLKLFYDTILIWLDPDMKLKVIKFTKQAQQLGFKVRTIFSNKDPKEYTDEEIKLYLDT